MAKNSFTFNFKKLPSAFILSVFMTGVLFYGGGRLLAATDFLPAPMFTGRITFDEKIRLMRNNELHNVEMLVMGSSIALNNLSTQEIFEGNRYGEKYLNSAAFGLSIADLTTYWKFLEKLYEPKVVVICVIPSDYNEGLRLEFNEQDLSEYVNWKKTIPSYTKYRNVSFMKRFVDLAKLRRTDKTMASVKFDKAGGVVLNVPKTDDLSIKRWDEKVDTTFNEVNYTALDQLSKTFVTKDIKLVYVVSPMRKNFLDVEDPTIVEKHWQRVEGILKSNNMHFINMHKSFAIEDKHFADANHLNRAGANMFTQALMKEMNRRGIFKAEEVAAAAQTSSSPNSLFSE